MTRDKIRETVRMSFNRGRLGVLVEVTVDQKRLGTIVSKALASTTKTSRAACGALTVRILEVTESR